MSVSESVSKYLKMKIELNNHTIDALVLYAIAHNSGNMIPHPSREDLKEYLFGSDDYGKKLFAPISLTDVNIDKSLERLFDDDLAVEYEDADLKTKRLKITDPVS